MFLTEVSCYYPLATVELFIIMILTDFLRIFFLYFSGIFLAFSLQIYEEVQDTCKCVFFSKFYSHLCISRNSLSYYYETKWVLEHWRICYELQQDDELHSLDKRGALPSGFAEDQLWDSLDTYKYKCV